MRESFLLAEAMGVSGIEAANPYRPDSQPQTEERGESSQLVKFLEELIRQKESHLECPVCLEVMFIFPPNFKDIVFAIFCCRNNQKNSQNGSKKENQIQHI